MTDPSIASTVDELTDAELVALTSGAGTWTTVGIERLGIPPIRLGDGPHGVRRPRAGAGLSMFDSHPATCFPTAVTLGSTWDAGLVAEVGVALGREAAAHGVAVLLGPGVNLKRTPTGGRDFEYFSEDPLVSAVLGAAWVDGVQSTGVGASLKHFVANDTERRRHGVDVVVDERTLRELYLAPFEHIVRHAGPATVMAAYNRVNGEHCAENRALLTGILREEWGFDGLVVSDWGASWDRLVSVPAGTDLTMPGLGPRDDARVLRGVVPDARTAAARDAPALERGELRRAVARILQLVQRHGPVAVDAPEPDLDGHHELARRAAAAGTVLLTNNGVLPLAARGRLALIGAMAKAPRFQGAGSSHVVPTRLDTLEGALRAAWGGHPDAVDYRPGYDAATHRSSAKQLAEAVAAARAAEVAVVVVGLPETFETEGVDREHLRLPEAHDALVDAVRAVNPRTVVVLQNGSPVELTWRDGVAAIVEAYLGGQAGGGALADVLLGVAEPGGRLAETFPVRYEDHPVSQLPIGPVTAEYREGPYLGYRWFDSAGLPVAFAFGHGLTYTSFAWGEPVLTRRGEGFDVEVTVENTGERAGSEVVQLYLHHEQSAVLRPEQELRAFAKATLQPGESRRLLLAVDRRGLSHWDVGSGGWAFHPGRVELRLGRSSRDILWRQQVELDDANEAGASAARDAVPEAYRHPSAARGFPSADFERMLGRPLPSTTSPAGFTLDTALGDMLHTPVGRLLTRFVHRQAMKTLGAPPGREVREAAGDVVAQLTFRMLPTVSDGLVDRRRTELLLALVNRLRFGRRR